MAFPNAINIFPATKEIGYIREYSTRVGYFELYAMYSSSVISETISVEVNAKLISLDSRIEFLAM